MNTERHVPRHMHTEPRVPLGRPHPVVYLAGIFVIGLSLWITGQVFFVPKEHLDEAVGGSAVFGLAAWASYTGMTSRVDGLAGRLEVANFLRLHTIGVPYIDRFDSRAGLEVVLRDGSRVKSWAYGRSVIGDLFGYHRAGEAATKGNAWLSSASTSPDVDLNQSAWRRAALLLPVWGASYAVAGLILYAIR